MLVHARAQIFIFEHARARSMLDFFILDATLKSNAPKLDNFKVFFVVLSSVLPIRSDRLILEKEILSFFTKGKKVHKSSEKLLDLGERAVKW